MSVATSGSTSNSEAALRRVGVLKKEGDSAAALQALQEALRRDQIDPGQLERAGRLIAKLRAAPAAGSRSVLLLGQCTTSWLAPSVAAVGLGRGLSLDVREGGFDNVLQELMVAEAGSADVCVLLPWTQRLLSNNGRSVEDRIAEEVAFWKRAWALVTERLGARILHVGHDWTVAGALGPHLSARTIHGSVSLIRRLNDALREALPAGAYFLDLEQVSAARGRQEFYDPRQYAWTKQPFSTAGVGDVARHVVAGIRALVTGPKKVLVLDLDNTLWGGVVGELGPLGISLGETPDGEAYRDFQRYTRDLGKRGVLLAVCSKNNPEDARGPFDQHPDMPLRLTDFAAFEASWDAKDAGLRRIAERLNLGLDSFVFFDDNPAEREQILQALPEVEVVDVPPDPAEYVRALEAGIWFESVGLSSEDTRRSAQYQEERARQGALESAGSLDDYLASLDMRATVDQVGPVSMQRVVQLIGKTNQFNVTSRRHSEAEVSVLLSRPGALGLTLSLADRFGDHGLVSVILAAPAGPEAKGSLVIDTWLMSCRVIARTAEDFLFNELCDRARALGYTRLIGEFIPTAKNMLVAGLFERLGFQVRQALDGAIRYELMLTDITASKTFVRVVNQQES